MKAHLLIVLVAVFVTPPAYADLVHHFPFDDDASDIVGGADGTLLNGASVSGGVLVLDGMDDYVHIGQHIVPTSGSYSVSLFARQTQIDGTYVEFISQGVSLGPGFYIGITPSHEIRVSDTWMSTGVPYPLDGLWHHIALTVDAGAGNSKLYLDGSLSATLGSAIAAGSGGNATRFGRQYNPFEEFFAGMLDDIRIYDHVLSAADVAVLAAIPEVSSFALLGLAAVGAGSIRLLRNTLRARFGSNRG